MTIYKLELKFTWMFKAVTVTRLKCGKFLRVIMSLCHVNGRKYLLFQTNQSVTVRKVFFPIVNNWINPHLLWIIPLLIELLSHQLRFFTSLNSIPSTLNCKCRAARLNNLYSWIISRDTSSLTYFAYISWSPPWMPVFIFRRALFSSTRPTLGALFLWCEFFTAADTASPAHFHDVCMKISLPFQE